MIYTLHLVFIFFLVIPTEEQQKAATDFLRKYNNDINKLVLGATEAAWKNSINITEHNSLLAKGASIEFSNIMKIIRKNASMIKLENVNSDTKRQFSLLLTTMASSNPEIVKNVSTLGSIMANIYSTARVRFNNSIIKSTNVSSEISYLSLDKHLTAIMSSSTNSKELLYAWKGWRDAVGPQLKKHYTEYVKLSNFGAREHKFEDAGDYKRKVYEVDNLQNIAELFWNELQPFYEEVHAYVRHRLIHIYPNLVKDGEPIPAHLLGNMWAQSWENIFPLVTPYPSKIIFY